VEVFQLVAAHSYSRAQQLDTRAAGASSGAEHSLGQLLIFPTSYRSAHRFASCLMGNEPSSLSTIIINIGNRHAPAVLVLALAPTLPGLV
jgi:hypothetical protein